MRTTRSTPTGPSRTTRHTAATSSARAGAGLAGGPTSRPPPRDSAVRFLHDDSRRGPRRRQTGPDRGDPARADDASGEGRCAARDGGRPRGRVGECSLPTARTWSGAAKAGCPRRFRPARAGWKRVVAMADGLRQVAALPDPVGEVLRGSTLPNGLQLKQIRVPMGVVGIIYEARPNVTVDAAGLCVKSGNAVLLRGSSSAAVEQRGSRRASLRRPAPRRGLPADSVQLVPGTDHESAKHLMRARGLVDVLIPRGGAGTFAASSRSRRFPSSRPVSATATSMSMLMPTSTWRCPSCSMQRRNA